MIGVALIGRGMAGTVFHAPLIEAAAGLKLVRIAGSAEAAAAIADPAVALVVIATPNPSHFPLAKAAIEAGKHVVVDKPFALSVAEADSLIALADERRRLLTVFHNRRWDGDFLAVRSVLESGEVGDPALLEAHWDRFRPAIKPGWREVPGEGAGLFYDLAPHMIDQALALFGAPEAIVADIETQRGAALVDDYFHLTLHYGAMRCILGASTLVAAPRPRFALHGTLGSFVSRGLDPQEAALKAGADPRAPGFAGAGAEGALTTGGTRRAVPVAPGRYLAFYEAVAEAIAQGGPAPVDPADARLGLHILEQARISAREGRRVSF